MVSKPNLISRLKARVFYGSFTFAIFIHPFVEILSFVLFSLFHLLSIAFSIGLPFGSSSAQIKVRGLPELYSLRRHYIDSWRWLDC